MKRIAILTLIVASLCGSGLCQYSAEFSSYYSGNRYDFRITPERLLSTPAWLEGEPNPPLSARSAKDIAAAYLNELFRDASGWRVGEISLFPVADRWVGSPGGYLLLSWRADSRGWGVLGVSMCGGLV